MEGRETEVVEGARFIKRFDNDNIGWLRLVQEIVSNRYDFVLYILSDLKPMKAKLHILNLLEAFESRDRK